MTKPTALQIFKAGTHTAEDGRVLSFSDADVQQIADSYDPALHEAPIVVGHPKADLPAYGWGKALQARDGVLFAEPQQVDPAFAEMVNAGRFKKISASIFMPDSPGNPTPGKFYLRHIGFLGAQPPSVKGLKSATFADGEDAACFAMPLRSIGWSLTDVLQRLRDWLIDKEGLETADQVIPQWQIRSLDDATRDDGDKADIANYALCDDGDVLKRALKSNPAFESAVINLVGRNRDQVRKESSSMSQENKDAQFAEREKSLGEQASALDAREKALAAREAAARREDAAAFAEGLVSDGKILPRNQAAVVELLLALPAGGSPLNFAEGDDQVSKPADQVLRELLTSLPKVVDFSEKSGGNGDESTPADFASPGNLQVDAAGLELHRKAVAFQAANPNTDYITAVKAVGGR